MRVVRLEGGTSARVQHLFDVRCKSTVDGVTVEWVTVEWVTAEWVTAGGATVDGVTVGGATAGVDKVSNEQQDPIRYIEIRLMIALFVKL